MGHSATPDTDTRDRLTSPLLIESGGAATTCLCGRHHPIGHARVRLGDILVSVTLRSDGVIWPDSVRLPPALKRDLAPKIEAEFLRIVADRWENERTVGNGVRR